MSFVAARRPHGSGDLVAGAQLAAADLRRRHVDILARLAVRLRTDEAAAVGQHVQDAAAHVLLALRLLVAALRLTLVLLGLLLPVRHRLLVVARYLGGRALAEVLLVILRAAGRAVLALRLVRLGGGVLVQRDLAVAVALALLFLGRGRSTLRDDDLVDQLVLAETAEAFEPELGGKGVQVGKGAGLELAGVQDGHERSFPLRLDGIEQRSGGVRQRVDVAALPAGAERDPPLLGRRAPRAP